MSVRVYAWPDGPALRFKFEQSSESYRTFSRRTFFLEGTASMAVFRTERSGLTVLSFLPGSEAAEPRLRGFLFDIRYWQIAGKVVSQHSLGANHLQPLWLSPEDWKNRVHLLVTPGRMIRSSGSHWTETKASILAGEWHIYEVSERDYRFVTGPIKTRAPVRTGTYGLPIVIRAKTLEALVDKVCKEFRILPDTKRDQWVKENVETGFFVRPSPEEVELLRMLDEKLPFFLPDEELKEWMSVALSEDGGR